VKPKLKKVGKGGSAAKKKASPLQDIAQHIEPEVPWEDSTLPQAVLVQLKEFCIYAKETQRNFRKWGFDQTIPHNNELSVLISDPTESGKTTAAEFIACELKMPLYRIDLGTLVREFSGETEKGVGQIFDSAETSNVILFFDEAEVLFGKRSQQTGDPDQSINPETDYLLQRLEQFSGIVILATRLQRSLIADLTARVRFLVEFPAPANETKKKPLDAVLRGFKRVLGKV
jgi:SpoVK/Ycf46/Vps4 family AAA+-type ATPase